MVLTWYLAPSSSSVMLLTPPPRTSASFAALRGAVRTGASPDPGPPEASPCFAGGGEGRRCVLVALLVPPGAAEARSVVPLPPLAPPALAPRGKAPEDVEEEAAAPTVPPEPPPPPVVDAGRDTATRTACAAPSNLGDWSPPPPPPPPPAAAAASAPFEWVEVLSWSAWKLSCVRLCCCW